MWEKYESITCKWFAKHPQHAYERLMRKPNDFHRIHYIPIARHHRNWWKLCEFAQIKTIFLRWQVIRRAWTWFSERDGAGSARRNRFSQPLTCFFFGSSAENKIVVTHVCIYPINIFDCRHVGLLYFLNILSYDLQILKKVKLSLQILWKKSVVAKTADENW